MKIIDAVAPYAIERETLACWRSLSNRTRRRAGLRHKLAHWVVGYFPLPNSDGSNAKDVQVKLGPATFTQRWFKIHDALPEADTPLSLKEVKQFRGDCAELYIDLSRLASTILMQRGGEKVSEVLLRNVRETDV